MTKKLMTAAAAIALSGFLLAGRPVSGPSVAVAAANCRGDRHHAVVDGAGLRKGAAIAAADGGVIALVGGGSDLRVAPADHASGVIRHPSSRPGVGTTYVRDRAGGDVVVAVTAAGTRRFVAHGEATHPSLSPEGSLVWAQGAGLRLAAPGAGTTRTIRGPQRHGTAFSPVFVRNDVIVAGIAAPATGAVPEDEYASDLWRYASRSGRWVRLTHFAGGADRWSIVRTPFLAPDGSIEFVRVHGRASQDGEPVFELWRLRGSVAQQVRVLPGEMYLAGFDGAARLWNLADGSTGAWTIQRETEDGHVEMVGCGAVAVDPLDRTDPDRRPGTRWASLSGSASTATGSETDQVSATTEILVGDFASRGDADAAASSIRSGFGDTPTVIDSTQAPTVIRPDVWAVVVPVGVDDPESDLARFRATIPELAGWSWLVSI